MNIIHHEQGKVFHLFNDTVSYILMVLPHGGLGSLYFGAALRDREGFEHLFERAHRGMTTCVFADSRDYSLDAIRQELPTYGSSDFRRPALNVLQENGSRILDLQFKDWRVEDGKPKLAGLPATYVESPSEAKTLIVTLEDVPTGLCVELLYTIFAEGNAIARSMRCHNAGMEMLHLQKVMSLSIDLPDTDYEWLELTGAWARERHVERRALATGITAIGSRRGHSSGQYNPFVALVRPETTEMQGEVLAVSLVYSGNFEMLAEVDNHGVTRLQAGIHSTDFDWILATGETFQTPEAVLVWSDEGLNGMTRTYHRLYQRRLARAHGVTRYAPSSSTTGRRPTSTLRRRSCSPSQMWRHSAAWSFSCSMTAGSVRARRIMRGSVTGRSTATVCRTGLTGSRRRSRRAA